MIYKLIACDYEKAFRLEWKLSTKDEKSVNDKR